METGVSGRPGGALGLSWDMTHLFSDCWPCLPHQPQSATCFAWKLLPGPLLPISPACLPQSCTDLVLLLSALHARTRVPTADGFCFPSWPWA